MEKIRILCYGDSNTWGQIPGTEKDRYDVTKRYTAVLQIMLGNDYEVISEGERARTIDSADFKFPQGDRNGSLYFAPCIYSHDPLDYVVILLGTNELKVKYNKSTKDIVESLENKYIKFLQEDMPVKLIKTPKIIVVAPSVVKIGYGDFEGAEEKSKLFNKYYKEMAKRNNCLFVRNKGLKVGIDGIHLTEQSHRYLAEQLYKLIKK